MIDQKYDGPNLILVNANHHYYHPHHHNNTNPLFSLIITITTKPKTHLEVKAI
jgi:hypothetical protein